MTPEEVATAVAVYFSTVAALEDGDTDGSILIGQLDNTARPSSHLIIIPQDDMPQGLPNEYGLGDGEGGWSSVLDSRRVAVYIIEARGATARGWLYTGQAQAYAQFGAALTMRASGAAWRRVGPIRNVTQPGDTAMTPRWQMVVEVEYVREDTAPFDKLEEVVLDITAVRGDSEIGDTDEVIP